MEKSAAAIVVDTKIEIQQRDIPRPIGTEVLVKIEAAGVCGTDIHLIKRSIPYLQPTVSVPGHEGIGRIIGLGPDVDDGWKIGDRVAHRWLYSICHECDMCKTENEQFCDRRKLSGKDVDGCWAEHTVVDTRYIMRVPEDIAAEDAAPILCAGTTAYRALRLAALKPGQWVGIVGCGGGLGHLAVQYAKALGLRVLGIDSADKESICRTLGTDVFIDFTQTKDLPADVIRMTDGGAHAVLVVSSSPKAYEQALKYVRKMGALVCIGITSTPMQFSIGPEYFVAKGVRLLGTSTGTMNDTKEALEFVRDGRVKPITVKRKLADIQDCLNAIEAGEIVGRYIISAT